MTRWAIIFRGIKVDEIEADDHFNATIAADKLGYSVTRIDIQRIDMEDKKEINNLFIGAIGGKPSRYTYSVHIETAAGNKTLAEEYGYSYEVAMMVLDEYRHGFIECIQTGEVMEIK